VDLFLWNFGRFKDVYFTDNFIFYCFVVVFVKNREDFLVFFIPSHVFHEEISRTHVLRTLESNVFEVTYCFIAMPLEDHSSLHQQNYIVEEIPNVSIRWVDTHDHSFIVLLSEILECTDNNESSEWIQPRSWLIQENHRRICNQLAADIYSFSLTSWNTFDELSTD